MQFIIASNGRTSSAWSAAMQPIVQDDAFVRQSVSDLLEQYRVAPVTVEEQLVVHALTDVTDWEQALTPLMNNPSIQIRGFLYHLLYEEGISKLVGSSIAPQAAARWALDYLSECISADLEPENEWPLRQFSAGMRLAEWFNRLWEQFPEHMDVLREYRSLIGEMYIAGDEDIRNTVAVGFLEHLGGWRSLRKFFGEWKSHPVLARAYSEGFEWGGPLAAGHMVPIASSSAVSRKQFEESPLYPRWVAIVSGLKALLTNRTVVGRIRFIQSPQAQRILICELRRKDQADEVLGVWSSASQHLEILRCDLFKSQLVAGIEGSSWIDRKLDDAGATLDPQCWRELRELVEWIRANVHQQDPILQGSEYDEPLPTGDPG